MMLVMKDVDYHYHQELFSLISKQSRVILLLWWGQVVCKSTLLALVAGFIEPNIGWDFSGRPVAYWQRSTSATFGNAVSRTQPICSPHGTWKYWFRVASGLKLTATQKQSVEQAAAQVGVAEYLDRLPEHLSGGQRQRVALARCFVQPHDIWLLDEPFCAWPFTARRDA